MTSIARNLLRRSTSCAEVERSFRFTTCLSAPHERRKKRKGKQSRQSSKEGCKQATEVDQVEEQRTEYSSNLRLEKLWMPAGTPASS